MDLSNIDSENDAKSESSTLIMYINYFKPMHCEKLSNRIEPRQVVNKTINKTHPYNYKEFLVSMVTDKANAMTPLINPEYQTTNSSLKFN